MQYSTLLAATALAFMGVASSAQAQTQPEPKQCFFLLGEQGAAQNGTALIRVAPDGKTVRLYFLRDAAPFNRMSHGEPFDTVAQSMRNQGDHTITPIGPQISFDNGEQQKATYTIAINGDDVTGQIVNPAGKPFPANGKCKKTS
jgi:hypothetical protein